MAIYLSVNELAHSDPSVYGTEKKLKLFYDETNNVRKLLLTENGFNVSRYDNFVLGGVAVDEMDDITSLKDLRDVLKIQKSAIEIKFDLIARGSFEEILGSDKLTKFFDWILKNNIKIHFANMNILNWALLDIIDSIIADHHFSSLFPLHRELKNELYRIVVYDVPGFLSLMRKYGYPNIERVNTSGFIKEIGLFVQKNYPSNPNLLTNMLKNILLDAQLLPELIFLVDEVPNQLINGFQNIFLNRIARFKNSVHVFDEEPTIQKAIKDIRIMDGSKTVDFSFADSKNVPGIQLSDVVSGFLGKYFTFIERTSPSALKKIKSSLSTVQVENLNLFRKLIDESHELSNGLLFKITTLDSEWKADHFLYGSELPPHMI